MKINKENICAEDKEMALSILNTLKLGQRVVGNPARGLEITLKELEKKKENYLSKLTKLDYELKDVELEDNIAKLKAGIEGEKKLADFLAQIIKYNDNLKDIIVIASVSQEQESNDKDYIPDSDFIVIHNDNFLIIDAKNINTNPAVPITLEKGVIQTTSDKPKILLEGIHSSEEVWRKYFEKNNIIYNNIDNVVCIVNKNGASIVQGDADLIHISELNSYLLNWKQKESSGITILADVTKIAKCQIKKEKSNLDLKLFKKEFKI